VVAAIVMVGLLFAAAFTVASAEEGTLERIKAQAPAVKRWAGWVLVAVGVWFIILAVFADLFMRIFPV
jgi:thiosulfate reductase cytochrome b subunit